MVLISKREKEKLVEQGCVWRKDIHRSHSKSPKYYLTESNRNLAKLDKIRKENII